MTGYSLEYEYQLYVTYFTFGGLTALCWTRCLAHERYKATVKCFSYIGYLILACVIGTIVANRGAYASSLQAPIDLFVAIATCLTILNMSFASEKPIQAIKCGLETPILSTVANFSYSLYLIHYPIVILICKIARDNVANDIVRVAIAMCALPISMAFAMLFASVFENQSNPIIIWLLNVFGTTQRRSGLSLSPRI
jgi:peptidoglycan/LPS O-acetylase OafA/YrhL